MLVSPELVNQYSTLYLDLCIDMDSQRKIFHCQLLDDRSSLESGQPHQVVRDYLHELLVYAGDLAYLK